MIAGRTALLASWAVVLASGCASTPEQEPVPEGAIEWGLDAAVDKSEVQVGEDFTLTLTLSHPPGGEIVPPASSEFGEFTVIDTEELEVSPVGTQLIYRLAAYRLPADLSIPPVVVRYRDAEGELTELRTDAIPVRLTSSLTPEVVTIHDIKDPATLSVPRDLSLLLWLLAALVLAALAYIIYRKLRRAPEEEREAVSAPPPPPELEAREALRRLEAKNLIERGALLRFYTELSEIMKRYAGRRFHVPYLERTTEEILQDLERSEVQPDAVRDLGGLLERADLVKFAKWGSDPDEARTTLERAKGFLERTWPAPVAPTPPDGAVDTAAEKKAEVSV
jgi:hypothetical protein